MDLSGPMRLALKMIVPLSLLMKQKESQVDGDISLSDNYIRPYNFSFGMGFCAVYHLDYWFSSGAGRPEPADVC